MRSKGARVKSKGRRASSPASRNDSARRSVAGNVQRSVIGNATGSAGAILWRGSSREKVVRKAVWRRTISLRLRASAAVSSAPVRRKAPGR